MASLKKMIVRRKCSIKSRSVPIAVAAKKSVCTVRSEEKPHSAQGDGGEEDEPKRPQTRLGYVRAVSMIHNITTDMFCVELEYFDVKSVLRRSILQRSVLLTEGALRKELVDLGAHLVDECQLAELVRASPPIREVTHNTGFHGRAFVLPKKTYGTSDRNLRYQPEGQNASHRGACHGTLEAWQLDLKPAFNASSYLILGAGTTFAAPIVSLIEVEETVAFHAYGESATGKTLLEKLCESIMGPAAEKNLTTLNRTPRSLNDLMAAHNGTVLLLNELKNADGGLARFLGMLSHSLTAGDGVDRSNFSKRLYRELKKQGWTIMALTTMERSIEAITRGKRDMGDRARHIDLPVPSRESGGIFDFTGLRQKSKVRKRAKELALEVVGAIDANYGVAFEAFITYVLDNRLAVLDRFAERVEHFVVKVAEAGDSWDGRLARKFGFAYAAAIIAIDAGVLPIRRKLCLRMFRKLYRKARGVFQAPDEQAKKVIGQLIAASSDGQFFPMIAKGDAAPSSYHECRGFRRKGASGLELAVNGQIFREWCNSSDVCNLVTERLKKAHALRSGHSGVDTRLVQIGKKRHRYYVINVGQLKIA